MPCSQVSSYVGDVYEVRGITVTTIASCMQIMIPLLLALQVSLIYIGTYRLLS